MSSGISAGPEIIIPYNDEELTLRFGNISISFPLGICIKMQAILPDDKVLPFVSPSSGKDKFGNPTQLTGTVKVTSSDTTIATIVQPDPTTPNDAASGIIVPTGKLGNVQIQWENDTDAATPLIALATVTVVVSATVSLGDPTVGAPRDLNATGQ